jgi:cobalt-zinc-cadmium efflux system membrane fusion protein
MTGEHRLILSPTVAFAAVLSVLLIGAGGTYLIMRTGSPPVTMPGGMPGAAGAEPTPAGTPGAVTTAAVDGVTSPRPDVAITLTQEAVERAGIEVSEVATPTGADHVRVPGVVEPNAYRQVAVTSLLGGRVVRVSAQLGDRVRRGQALAQVYGPELADARTKYIAAKSMLDAHDRELQRTQKLVEIGAASRQELERIHAEHAAQTAEVESARARLQLLGAAGDDAAVGNDDSATITIPAPIDGIVTERLANPGLNVDPTVKLFSIVDLSSVWIVADVYERDLSRVREGAPATVTAAAYPGLSLRGRVSYIDPQLNASTRTAKARIEVTNPRGELRLGMFTDVAIETAPSTSVASVPTGAIQNVADRQVVYVTVPGEPTTFIEREVRVGRSPGDAVEVVSGLNARDSVVSKGSFFVRAEIERRGLRPAQGAAVTGPATMSGSTSAAAEVQTAKVVVTEKGYEPDTVTLRSGVPARLTIVRMTDRTCGTEIVFPSLNIRRALPLNEAVVIEFTPAKAGDIAFACGMNMLKGVVVVQ